MYIVHVHVYWQSCNIHTQYNVLHMHEYCKIVHVMHVYNYNVHVHVYMYMLYMELHVHVHVHVQCTFVVPRRFSYHH